MEVVIRDHEKRNWPCCRYCGASTESLDLLLLPSREENCPYPCSESLLSLHVIAQKPVHWDEMVVLRMLRYDLALMYNWV